MAAEVLRRVDPGMQSGRIAVATSSSSADSRRRRRNSFPRSAFVRRAACLASAAVIAAWAGNSAAAWLGWRGLTDVRRQSRLSLGAWSAKKASTNIRPEDVTIDDVNLVSMNDEGPISDEDLAPELMEESKAAELAQMGNEKKRMAVIAERRKTGAKDMGDSSLGGKFGGQSEELVFDRAAVAAAADDMDAAAARLTVRKKDGLAKNKKKGGGRRWLVGRGGAKRQKLTENNELEEWLGENGVWISEQADWGREAAPASIAIETRETIEGEVSGRGLIARRDINLYEELAKIPMDLVVTKNASRALFGKDIITEEMPPYVAMTLFLVYQKYVMKEDSKWLPYINVLPSLEETGSSWTWEDEELESVLHGSPIVAASRACKLSVLNLFQDMKHDFMKKDLKMFPDDAFTEENYMWGMAMCFSRAARLMFKEVDQMTPMVALVPYVDLINHNMNANTYILARYETSPFDLDFEEKYVVVKADRYYARYEQIYISYGSRPNAELLLFYGFSLERNPQDSIVLPFDFLLDDLEFPIPFREEKKEWLKLQKAPALFPLFRDRFTEEMWTYLRILVIDAEDMGIDEDLPKAEVFDAFDSLNFAGPLSESMERRAVQLVKEYLEELEKQYPTTQEEDEAILQDRALFEMLPKNTRNAVRVRFGEKVIIEASLTVLDRMLASIQRITELQNKDLRKRSDSAKSFWGRMGVEEQDPGFKPITGIEDLMRELDMM